jgi:hypothetical protein
MLVNKTLDNNIYLQVPIQYEFSIFGKENDIGSKSDIWHM